LFIDVEPLAIGRRNSERPERFSFDVSFEITTFVTTAACSTRSVGLVLPLRGALQSSGADIRAGGNW